MGGKGHAVLVTAMVLVAPACVRDVFVCQSNDDCTGAGPGAACEVDGFCSVEDDRCTSGRRYGELVDASVAGSCVPSPDQTSTGTTSGTTSSTTTTLGTTSTTTTESTSAAVAPSSSSTGVAASSGGTMTQELEITASVATCTDATNNDPSQCEASTSTDGFSVDLSNGPTMLETTGFVAFDLDAVPAGAELISAALELTATDLMDSEGANSGEIWQVEPFTLESLESAQPAAISSTALAVDQGPVMISQTLEWPLALDTLPPDGLYLAVTAISDMGVDYWTTEGKVPPRLLVTFSPP